MLTAAPSGARSASDKRSEPEMPATAAASCSSPRPHKPTDGELSAKLEAAAAARTIDRAIHVQGQADAARADDLRRELAALELEAQFAQIAEVEAEMEELQLADLQRAFGELRVVAAQRLHAQAAAEQEREAMRLQVERLVFENERQELIAATDTAAKLQEVSRREAAEEAARDALSAVAEAQHNHHAALATIAALRTERAEADARQAEETDNLLALAAAVEQRQERVAETHGAETTALEAEKAVLRESLLVATREKVALRSSQASTLRKDKAELRIAADKTTEDIRCRVDAAHQVQLRALREAAALDLSEEQTARAKQLQAERAAWAATERDLKADLEQQRAAHAEVLSEFEAARKIAVSPLRNPPVALMPRSFSERIACDDRRLRRGRSKRFV